MFPIWRNPSRIRRHREHITVRTGLPVLSSPRHRSSSKRFMDKDVRHRHMSGKRRSYQILFFLVVVAIVVARGALCFFILNILFKTWNRWWWWSRSLRKRWRICICVTGDHQNMGCLGSLASGIASTSTFTIQRSFMTLVTSSLLFLRNPISDILLL